MPRYAKKLTATQVQRLTHGTSKQRGEPCTVLHAVGHVPGLLLRCAPSGARSWILRALVKGRQVDMGLGNYPLVSLAQARERAKDMKDEIWRGGDPVAEKKAAKAAEAKRKTYKEVADDFVAMKAAELKTQKQKNALRAQVEYAFPILGGLPVAEIEVDHVLQVLTPVWTTKHEAAKRVRMRIEAVLKAARTKGLIARGTENPARWRDNLENVLPKGRNVAQTSHHKALAYADAPPFWEKLAADDSMGANVLRFAILTAARSSEAREARWSDIDLERAVWTIAGENMKAGRVHRVPLCATAVALLQSLPRLNRYVFPGRGNNPISDSPVKRARNACGFDTSTHGFRTAFTDWARECTHSSYREEVIDLALAHVETNATKAAYGRSDLFEMRRKLMGEWEQHVLRGGEKPRAEVIPIRANG